MRKIREVLRLKHDEGLPHRAIAQACAMSVSGHEYLKESERGSVQAAF